MGKTLTNREFAAQDTVFQRAVALIPDASVRACSRQASKFRRKRGAAFAFRQDAIRAIEAEKEANASETLSQ